MRTSGEYRRIARERLSDKWGKAIIAAMIMSFLGVSMAFVDGNVTVNYEDTSVSPLTKLINHPAWAKYAGFFAAVSVLITIISVINFVIGGAADLGYARFNMRIAEGDDVETVDIFSQMKRLIDGFVYRLLMVIYLILWTLCFIIPGIVKTFSYALTPYIMNDYPQLSPNQAITMSRKVMDGRKAKLFGLYLSFMGYPCKLTEYYSCIHRQQRFLRFHRQSAHVYNSNGSDSDGMGGKLHAEYICEGCGSCLL